MITASDPLHVFNNTPAPIGFSPCQKLIGTDAFSALSVLTGGDEDAKQVRTKGVG
jgi:hypothetical protein